MTAQFSSDGSQLLVVPGQDVTVFETRNPVRALVTRRIEKSPEAEDALVINRETGNRSSFIQDGETHFGVFRPGADRCILVAFSLHHRATWTNIKLASPIPFIDSQTPSDRFHTRFLVTMAVG